MNMKNNEAMNLSDLAASGTDLDLTIAEVQGKVTVKRLRTRGPRKGETLTKAQGAGRVVGNVRGTDSNAAGVSAGTNGARMTLTTQRGQGAQMVDDLDTVKARYARVKAAEHRADRAYEAELRRAEREAAALAAIDDLLSEV
jgi:hypothetical protein